MKAEDRLVMVKALLCPLGLLCVTQENQLPRQIHETVFSAHCHFYVTAGLKVIFSAHSRCKWENKFFALQINSRFFFPGTGKVCIILHVFCLLTRALGSNLSCHTTDPRTALSLHFQCSDLGHLPKGCRVQLIPKQAILPWERQGRLPGLLPFCYKVLVDLWHVSLLHTDGPKADNLAQNKY